MNFDKFRINLQTLIKNSGKTSKDIAVDINMSAPSLSRYISGTRNPDIESVVKLSTYFGVSVDWMIGLTDERESALSPEISDMVELYSIASSDDKRIIKVILDKYIQKNNV